MSKLLQFNLVALTAWAILALGAVTVHAQTPISGLPAATTPLVGNELTVVVQGGTTKNTPVNSIFNPTAPPAIGTVTPNNGAFANLTANGTVAGGGFSNLFASPYPIGGTLPSTGAFTGLSASGLVSGTGFSTYLASPPAIGGTAANAINGTTGGFSGAVTGASGAFTGLDQGATVNATSALQVNSQLLCSATLPTVTGSGFGSGPTVTADSSCSMAITVGTSPAAASGTITLPAAKDGWVCTGNDTTTQSTTVAQLKQVTGGSATTALIQNFTDIMGTGTAWTAADVLLVHCTPY